MAAKVEGERGTQAVNRALRMLESFRSDRSELSVSELAESSDLTLPTAHRLARALQGQRFLVQSEGGHGYSLGPEIMRLARLLLQSAAPEGLFPLAQSVLGRLRDETGETGALYCVIGQERVCVSEAPSTHPIHMANGVGNLYPLHSGAAGKAILAWMSPTDIDEVLQARADAARVRKELTAVRRRGFAVSLGETVPAASAIASPIRNPAGRVIGALAVSGPIQRWTKERMLKSSTTIIAASKELSDQLASSSSAGSDPSVR